MSVVIETTLGDLTVDLFLEERPLSCLNFLKLCKIKYYNLCLFHSVNANFCAQTGDPSGKGDGGESVHGLIKGQDFRFYQGETQPKIKHDRLGLVSMASHGDGMFGSQFIITLSSNLGSLDGEHCVFGQIVEGSEVLLKLNEAITDEQHRPYQDIRITHTVILDDPFPNPSGLGDPPPSPVPPSTKDIAFSRIPADEPLKNTCSQEELDEMVQAREAAARATILEMVGDLPDADVAPPENVLFVCKLNPVTTDHDLSIIFSRFGKVKSCEVIRDNVTGDSLQYAFVEFDNQKSCEEAYFKMDNVLIDDRRIHVDFSQSVAKWRGKGKGVELLVPPPVGGWGNKKRSLNNRLPQENNRRGHFSIGKNRYKTDEKEDRTKNGNIKYESADRNINNRKKEMVKKKKRTSSTSSSETSESSSSSDSSESEPVRKKKRRRTEKVLLVVKTPFSKRNKKKRVQNKSARYDDSDTSDSARLKRKKKKTQYYSSSMDSSSDESIKSKRRKRKQSSLEEKKKKGKRKKRGHSEDSSDSSSIIKIKKAPSKKKRKRSKQSDSSDEELKKSKKKKIKTKAVKKRRKQKSSDSSSSCD